jgi:hypothetical protein
MSRQWIVDVALRAYPCEMRDSRGAEMRDTALDLSGHSPWRLVLESLSLARGGLRARASASAPPSRRDFLADCSAYAATVYGLMLLALLLGSLRWLYASSLPSPGVGSLATKWLPLVGLLAFSAGLALVGHRRLAGLAGMAWIGFYLAKTLNNHTVLPSASHFAYDVHSVALTAVPLACYLVMIVVPVTRPRRSRRLGWLLGAWLLGGIVAPPQAPLELFGSIGFENALLISILIVGVFSLSVNAWRAVALALTLLAFGLGAWTSPFISDRYEYLPLALMTLGPIVLMAGATARLVSARRGLAS